MATFVTGMLIYQKFAQMRLWFSKKQSLTFAIMKQSVFCLSLLFISLMPLNATTIFFTFADGREGGIAKTVVDPNTGKIQTIETLASARGFDVPHKIALSTDGRFIAGVSEEERKTNFIAFDLSSNQTVGTLRLRNEPDAIAAAGDSFVIGASSGDVYRVSMADARLRSTWNSRESLRPSGHKVEYITVVEDRNQVWFSFQKDSRRGDHRGSRILLFSIEPFRLQHDIQLPRNRPDLHMTALRERGPNPEYVQPLPNSNALLVSYDLYGAVAIADLDAAERGEWKNPVMLSTSPSGSWGDAFPDRATFFQHNGRDFCLMANQGQIGGTVLIDVKAREIAQIFETEHGLAAPIFLPKAKVFASIKPGKLKFRSGDELVRNRFPMREIDLFVLPAEGATTPMTFRTVPFDRRAQLAVPVAAERNNLLFVLTQTTAGENFFTVVDPLTGEVIDEKQAPSAVGRLLRKPD
jgi:hypothetical protein